MKIYTKTGDGGDTGLFAGPRVRKDHPRIEAYGTADELNSVLGVVRAGDPPQQLDDVLSSVQHELFALGAELATPEPQEHGMELLGSAHIERLERTIDKFEADLPPLRQFILPGGVRAAAELHFARTVCRRAERCLVTLADSPEEHVRREAIVYLNRLSDLLFVLARWANRDAGREDIPWRKEAP
ncbi:MAG: cob(I)yrinic acid a,c-diamide adenosyltransferase [Planctomycetes bacterium]|nr:cob(I)yrinic acid a,c-diamide adenosyltransferase [Planctomycetota bacterium]